MALSEEKRRIISSAYHTTDYSGNPVTIRGTLATKPLQSGGSPQQKGAPAPSVSKNQLISAAFAQTGYAQTPVIDSTFATTAGKAYEEVPSITKNALEYSMAQDPTDFKIIRMFDDNGKFNPHMREPTEVYGEDFFNLSPEDRGKRIKEVQNQQIQEAYANAGSNPWGTVAGSVAGALADPTTVAIPGGGSVRGAVAIGAAVGGADMALQSKLEKGEIDGSDVALGMAFGGAGAGLIYAGGKAVANLLSDSVRTTTPVDAGQVKKAMEDSGTDMTQVSDVDALVEAFNEAAGLTKDAAVKRVREAVKLHRKGLPADNPRELYSSINSIMDKFGDTLSDQEKSFLTSTANMYKSLDEGTKLKVPARVGKSGKVSISKQDRKILEAYNSIMEQADEHVTKVYDDYVRQTDESLTDDMLQNVGADMSTEAPGPKEAAVASIARGNISKDSKVGRTLEPPIGKLSDNMTDQKASDMVNLTLVDTALSTPRAVLQNKLGAPGRRLADSMVRHQEAVNWDVANRMTDFKNIMEDNGFYSLRGSEQKLVGEQVTDLLRKELSPRDAHPMAVEIANRLRGEFERTLDDMVKLGALSKIEAAALRHNARKNGYAPRVFNQEYLATSKGEKHFMEVLTSAKLTKKQADEIVKKWGGNASELSPKGVIKNSDGTYRLSRGTASKIYNSRLSQGKRTISSHIERERTLGLPDHVLRPFLRNDIRSIIEDYYYDVYRGARASELFGKNGEKAAEMLGEIHEKFGDEAYKFAANTYSLYSRVEVNGAERLQKYLNQPAAQRRVINWMRSAMTPLLYTAQLLNLTQATINGFVYLAGRQGIPKALATTYRGFFKTFNPSKDNIDFLDRTGAAIQTQLLQIVNEHGDLPSRLSSLVLKYTGFQLVEEMQRRVAASIGKTYVESLLDKHAKLVAKRASNGLSKAEDRELNKTVLGLKEMGISPDREITVADLQMASQRFSNATNFATGPDQLPLAWQSPFMSLVRQFKSFAFLQGKFLKDQIVEPMKKGEFGRAANAMLAFGLAPWVTGGLPALVGEVRKKWYTGEWSEDKLEVALQAYSSIGGLGLIFDTAMRSVDTTPERFLAGLAGPSLSTAAKLATGVGNTVGSVVSGEGFTAEPLARSLLKAIPGGHKVREYTLDKNTRVGFQDKYQGMMQGR